MPNDDKRRISLRGILLIVIATIFVSFDFYFYGTLRHAQLGLIDDHEIIRFLSPSGVIYPWDIPRILATETEIGQWGHALRVRPVYYFLRIVEAMLWRDNGGLWYLSRMFVVATTAWVAAYVVIRTLSSRESNRTQTLFTALAGFAVGSLVLTMPAWSDIATRLGPSEVYVSLGLALIAIGFLECYRRPWRTVGWMFLCAGTLIVVGSKEDGALVVVPMAIFYLMRFGQAGRRWLVALLGFIALAVAIYVVIGIALGTAASEADMYGNGRTVSLFLQVLPGDRCLWEAVAIFVFALVWDLTDRRAAKFGTTPRSTTVGGRILATLVYYRVTLAAGVGVYLILGEAFFYQNYISPDGVFTPARYGFLSQLTAISEVVVLLTLLLRLPSFAIAWKAIVAAAAVALIGTLPPVSNLQWATQARSTSVRLSQYSLDVNAQIRAGAADLKAHPGAQVALLIGNPLDYERAMSLPEYLAFYGADNPVFLAVDIPRSISSSTPQFADLSRQLTDIGKSGKMSDGWLIVPTRRLQSTSYTACFSFITVRENPMCDSVKEIG